MNKKTIEICLKILLFGAVLIFVGALCVLRVMNMGWYLIIFGLGLAVWVLIHLGLMAVFIAFLRLKPLDIILFLAVHFFYLWAWLFQVDGGDIGGAVWTFQQIIPFHGLDPFLNDWGEIIFWVMGGVTLVGYIWMVVLLVMRLVRHTKNRRKTAALILDSPAG
jgi:hypothetical protein